MVLQNNANPSQPTTATGQNPASLTSPLKPCDCGPVTITYPANLPCPFGCTESNITPASAIAQGLQVPQDITNAVTNAVTGDTAGANSLGSGAPNFGNWQNALQSFLSNVQSRNFWKGVGLLLGGAAVIALGAFLFLGRGGDEDIAKVATA